MVREEQLLPVHQEALARLIEYGNRLADHQEKMTTRLEDLADLLREAHFYAQEDSAEKIGSDQVTRAVREKRYRSDLYDEKIKELIAEGVIQIDLKGSEVGQVNGLSVLDLGDIQFGRPSKITASVSLGDSGVMDIERESEMGGPIHTKGVLILSGFLYDKFGFDKPVSLSVRLVFEQNYSGVDGDSASGAELCAILSRLSGIPLKQNVAVTGSVNQKGEIQAVGGINEKIEGFYEVCVQAGLTGEQGVIIPASNRPNLMLREDIVLAVEEGAFRIWAVDRLEDILEILTDRKAGEAIQDEDGRLTFEPTSVYAKVDNRLQEMARLLRQEKGE